MLVQQRFWWRAPLFVRVVETVRPALGELLCLHALQSPDGTFDTADPPPKTSAVET